MKPKDDDDGDYSLRYTDNYEPTKVHWIDKVLAEIEQGTYVPERIAPEPVIPARWIKELEDWFAL